jgi:hypothetical protein
MLIGDFNEAMWLFEHFSSQRRLKRQMLDFCEVLSHYDVHDLSFIGVPWTYNKLMGDINVNVRSGGGLTKLVQLILDARVRHLVTSHSNHLPIFLELEHDKVRDKNVVYQDMRSCENERNRC